jgi:hypothetical protein
VEKKIGSGIKRKVDFDDAGKVGSNLTACETVRLIIWVRAVKVLTQSTLSLFFPTGGSDAGI